VSETESLVIALGNNAHLFARPSRRAELAWCFETPLRCGPVRSIEHPGHPYYVMAPGGQVFTIAPLN
jgi:hypothetical protein